MAFPPTSSLRDLMDAPMRPGAVTWIGVRGARRAPMTALQTVAVVAGEGLIGDRYSRRDGARQATLIAAESLKAIASHLGRETVLPEDLRRNIVVEGLNLLALKERRFQIGTGIFETTGECHPCSFLEAQLGVGGYNAARGLGGITARVIQSGQLSVGDRVVRL